MRWHTETNEEYKARKSRWKKWFAWYPVQCTAVDKSYEVTIWLAYVYRREVWDYGYDGWWLKEHRTIETHEKTL